MKKERHGEQYLFGQVGVANIRGNANEDKFCLSVTKDDTLVAFGVFDGHGGSLGSTLCSQVFCQGVFSTFDQSICMLSSDAENFDKIGDDLHDALLCESIRRTSEMICQHIKDVDTSGTTCTTLFVRKLSNGTLRVYCSNTGDSRAVWFKPNYHDVICLSNDHTLKSPKEVERIRDKRLPYFSSLPLDPLSLEANAHISRSSLHGENYPTEVQLRAVENAVKNIPEIDATFFVSAFATTYSSLRTKSASRSTKRRTGKHTQPQPARDLSTSPGDSISTMRPLVHEHSFIAPRGADDLSGTAPLALFGRYGISVMMTRSLGDKFGPRCCVNCPEITAVDIGIEDRARFVLGSDGLWDVVSLGEAKALVGDMSDPLEAAEALAERARTIRRTRKIRLDDITCLVVDVWPQRERQRTTPSPSPPTHPSPQVARACLIT